MEDKSVRGKMFKKRETVSMEVLKQKKPWHISGTEMRPMRLDLKWAREEAS